VGDPATAQAIAATYPPEDAAEAVWTG